MKEYELYVDSFYQIPGVSADTGGSPDGTVSDANTIPERAVKAPNPEGGVVADKIPLIGTTEVKTPANELWWSARLGAEEQVDRDVIDGPKTVNYRD